MNLACSLPRAVETVLRQSRRTVERMLASSSTVDAAGTPMRLRLDRVGLHGRRRQHVDGRLGRSSAAALIVPKGELGADELAAVEALVLERSRAPKVTRDVAPPATVPWWCQT